MDYSKIKTVIRAAVRKIYIIIGIVLTAGIVLISIAAYCLSKTPSPKETAAEQNVQSAAPENTLQSPKTIYLTLDMDMNERMQWLYLKKKVSLWYDPALFSYLEENNIAATFFVSGLFAKTYPDLMRSLASYPIFSFQNHSYDESSFVPHCYWLATLKTEQEKINQIDTTETIIKETTGQSPAYFRFPGLCQNSANDALITKLGLTINDATIIAGDPFNKKVGAMVEAVMSRAQNNGVIIMHIGGPNAPESLAVLEQIVPKLQAEGYAFAKL